jgi:hypothetical protein
VRLERALFHAQAQQHGRPTPEHWRRVMVRARGDPSQKLRGTPILACILRPLWCHCTPARVLQNLNALFSLPASQLAVTGGLLVLLLGVRRRPWRSRRSGGRRTEILSIDESRIKQLMSTRVEYFRRRRQRAVGRAAGVVLK